MLLQTMWYQQENTFWYFISLHRSVVLISVKAVFKLKVAALNVQYLFEYRLVQSLTGFPCLVILLSYDWMFAVRERGEVQQSAQSFLLRSYRTMVLLSEYIWGEELNLLPKVGTLNMKMLDHLLEIRDNPVRLQLLEASCADWICCLFCGSSVLLSAVCSQTQTEWWSKELATSLSLLLCAISPFIILNTCMKAPVLFILRHFLHKMILVVCP